MNAFQNAHDLPADCAGTSSCNCSAVLIDWENVRSIGAECLANILREIRAQERICVLRAYADWVEHQAGKSLLAKVGVELTEMPGNTFKKNSADLKLAVDAVEILFTCPHVTTLIVVSGDRDFVPLVQLARRLGRKVWCFGYEDSTSQLLKQVCDHWTLIPKPTSQSAQWKSRNDIPHVPNLASTDRLPKITYELRNSVAQAFQEAWQINDAIGGDSALDRSEVQMSRFFACLRRADSSFNAHKFCGRTKRVHALSARRLVAAGVISINDSNPTSPLLSPTEETQELIDKLTITETVLFGTHLRWSKLPK